VHEFPERSNPGGGIFAPCQVFAIHFNVAVQIFNGKAKI
jgi:hypothetical protein